MFLVPPTQLHHHDFEHNFSHFGTLFWKHIEFLPSGLHLYNFIYLYGFCEVISLPHSSGWLFCCCCSLIETLMTKSYLAVDLLWLLVFLSKVVYMP
jgi:hypothetical protein